MDNIPQKSGIYKLTNKVNGMIYIGKSINLYHRIIEGHQYSNEKNYLSRAIKKYSWKNFEIEILAEFDKIDNIQLLALEVAFIEYFNSINRKIGYNICLFSNDKTGIKLTKQHKEKISNALRKYKINNPEWCRNKSQECLKNMSEAQNKLKKQIKQLTKEGSLIKIWPSLSEAATFILNNKLKDNKVIVGDIGKAAKNKKKTAYGYRWEYL